jgi:hypothetical protein
MSRSRPDALTCGRRPGPTPGLLCENCAGRCPVCDSHCHLRDPVLLCGECALGALRDRCLICGGAGKHAALYCRDCVLLGRSRDGCPRIVNAGLSRNDLLYERRRAAGGPDF